MKKIVSLVMAIVMVALMLPVGVLAAGSSLEITLYSDASNLSNSINLTNKLVEEEIISSGETGITYTVKSGSANVVEISAGEATAIAEQVGKATYYAMKGDTIVCEINFNVVKKSPASLSVTVNPGTYGFDYEFKKSDLSVTLNYDNGDAEADLAEDKYDFTVSNTSKAGEKKIDVVYKDDNKVKGSVTVSLAITDVYSVELVAISESKFTVGDTLPNFTVKVMYSSEDKGSVVSDGFSIYLGNKLVDKATYTLKESDNGKTFKVLYNGVFSDESVVITVNKATGTESGSGSGSGSESSVNYTAVLLQAPTKVEYIVGESFATAGMIVAIYKNGALLTNTVSYPTYTAFTSADVGTNKTFKFRVNFVDGTTAASAELAVTGITVKTTSQTLTVSDITEVKMKLNEYSIGHRIDISDINYFKYRASVGTMVSTLYSTSFSNYDTSNFTLEVLSKNQTTKAYNKTIIQDTDVWEDDGETFVWLRFSVGSVKSDPFAVYVAEPKVSYYYDDDLIATYSSLTTALSYTEIQDPDINTIIFDLSDVDDDESIVLVLGADASMSTSSAKFDVKHNIEIDLNGHDLTFRSTTVDDFDDDDYTVTIKNTAEEEATFTYYDKSIDIILGEDDEFVFEKGYDEEDYLPGVVVVTLDVPTTGTVTANKTITNNKIAVGMGNEVKLTITPKSGYGIDTVLLGGKSVTSSSDYKLTSTGATYTFKPKENVIAKITFKETAADWDNPFTDVSSTAKYYTAVAFVCENGLFQGVSSTKFSPNGTMTRAMFATVLARLADVDVSRYTTSSFTDVSSSDLRLTDEMVQSIEWACRMGLVEGYGDGTFGPHNEITHQQMYLIMYRYTLYVENKPANVSGTTLTVADKNDVADWALNGVKFAEKNDILVASSSNKITPKDAAVRSELAMLLQKYCNNVLGWADEE